MSGTASMAGCAGASRQHISFSTTAASTTLALQHQFADDLQWFRADLVRHQQQFDKGAVAAGLLEDAVSDGLDGDRQIPFAEPHAIA